MKIRLSLVNLLFVLLTYTLPTSASTWVEYSTPHFQLYTNASTAVAEDWVTTLDAFANLIPAAHPSPASPSPYKVIVISDYGLYHTLKPNNFSSGFTYTQDDNTYLIVGRQLRPYPPEQHKRLILSLFNPSYMHWTLTGYPAWFHLGAASLFTNIELHDDKAIINTNITGRFTSDPAVKPMDLHDLMFNLSALNNPIYRPNANAYVHYLLFGSVNGYPDYRTKLANYLSSAAPQSSREDFEQAMGQPLATLQTSYERYLQEPNLKAVAIHLINKTTSIHQRQLGNDELNYLMARLLIDHGQYDYARKYFKKISKGSPQSIQLQHRYQQYEASRQALKAAEKSLKQNDDDEHSLALIANHYWETAKKTSRWNDKKSNTSSAIDYAERALAINPDNKEMHILLRFAYQSQGNREQAFVHIKEYYRLEPDNAAINTVMGTRFIEKKDYASARLHLNRACELDSKLCEFTQARLKEVEQSE
ncbi:tetratricopeptide repeat protein [Cellvibrio japonicus]|uniref:TPR domain protein n=1 Tax=Cellvibrio japonicus (strain Ueda107) TaxID=498211 RepID=B3PB80_CELJU|nr:hypothetical protein [Cellvibrio japonicus]ACE83792.1 hypothetical protein CJA_1052 [Cellvibrio japonicus Ueda107]QEI11668.1 hypothetical protein FY117_05110 [Cellvibrio japonicus]QEI15242.1 hypothetical protein FY116_05110 [Cellvibrio japonicus]QEI18822.1 hypothetical protein FY115_05110 [Cellvibrio japonicus]